MRVNREVGRDVPFLGCQNVLLFQPVNRVMNSCIRTPRTQWGFSRFSLVFPHSSTIREEIGIINHLEPTIISHADASSRNGATSTLINASRKRSEERLIRKEPVRVHVEVESGLWCSRRHYGPPESGSSRPYTHILLNSGQEIKN